jgi:uncharacterized repeat protein (TIGR01451 family)
MTMPLSARRRSLPTVLWILFLAALSPAAAGQYVQQGSKLVGTGSVTGPILNSVAQGYSVSISADGNTAVIGGPYDNDFVGASWVFTRSAGVFSQQGPKLVGTGAVAAGHQGFSVAISGDGNTIAVTNPGDAGNVGAVWIFTRSGSVWSQQGAKLVASDASGAATFGSSVALSGDGNTLITGGPADSSSTGAAWIFVRTAGVWSQQGSKLAGIDAIGPALQGISVSLSTDGNTAVVGGDHDNFSLAGGVISVPGAAWVYTRSGATWTQQGAKLVGTGSSGAIVQQGHAVAVSGDGNTLMSGGWVDNAGEGATWVFVRSAGAWSQQGAKLVGTGAVPTANQGGAVSLSSDGNTGVIGGSDDNAPGTFWFFTRSGGVWSQLGSKRVGTGGLGTTQQGFALAISADASTAIDGGPSDSFGVGAAWIFAAGPVAAPPAISKAFGTASLALNGTTSLTFTLQNNNASTLTGVGFTDALPAGLAVSSPNGLTGSCGGGAITAIAGSGSVSLSGATLAGAASCNFRVNVTGTTLGIKNNVTGAVTSVESGPGGTASASVTVAAVTSFTGPTATGSGSATVSFTGGGAACQFTSAAFIPLVGGPSSPPAGSAPAGVAFPHGLLDFATSGCTPAGATLNFTVVYPQLLPPGTLYWKYGKTTAVPAPHWYTIPAIVAGSTITFSITDGGLGDDDLAANGAVVDAGGAGAPPTGASFYPLPPCRVGDTRKPSGPLDGPSLQPGATRSFAPAGVCGIPSGAVAISVNLTVTNVGAAGELIVFPSDVAKPVSSSISFGAGRTRANNDVVALSGAGSSFSVLNNSTATVDFILDVNGYFR